MADLDLHLSALEKCRTAIYVTAGQYLGILTGHNPGELTYDDRGEIRNQRTPVARETFGALDDSAALAAEAGRVWDTIIGEMDAARRKLKGVEGGLSSVEENVRAAHRATE